VRIAQVAPLYESVPPRAYGGTERVVSYLTEALVQMGHEVTLFASGDSVTSATLVPVVPRSLRLNPGKPDGVVWHTIMMDKVLEEAARFDIVHFHIDVLQLPLMRYCRTPSLSTAHGRLDLPDLKPLFRCFAQHPMVSISDSQRAPVPWANWRATVHHGLPLGLYAFHPQPREYFAFVGRISPEKRADRAIEIAKACGVPLRIAAKVDPADRDYFHRVIEPLLDHPLVTFHGEVGDREKDDLVGHAMALLMPIDWPEPFGLVMIEALACGTPVIAYNHGSVPEIIEHGVTGFVVGNQDEAIQAARNVRRIDRRRCRQAFEERFSSRVMARRYLDVYHELVAARSRREPMME
jgi:glycosyltransferase involved in cell wall biosynthesis